LVVVVVVVVVVDGVSRNFLWFSISRFQRDALAVRVRVRAHVSPLPVAFAFAFPFPSFLPFFLPASFSDLLSTILGATVTYQSDHLASARALEDCFDVCAIGVG
jgi:hypothetical protein